MTTLDLSRVHNTSTCTACGIPENMELLDGKLDDAGEATDNIECIRCYGPHWAPTGMDSFDYSIAPALKPLYDAYRAAEIERENANTAKMKAELEAHGFACRERDPRLNTDFPGAFMVVDPKDYASDTYELPTRDGSNGPWCIVGDDLDALIRQAHDIWSPWADPEAE